MKSLRPLSFLAVLAIAMIIVGCTTRSRVEYVPVYVPVTVVVTPETHETPQVEEVAVTPTTAPPKATRVVEPPKRPTEPKEVILKFGECYKGPQYEFCNTVFGNMGNVIIKRDGEVIDFRLLYTGYPQDYKGYRLQVLFGAVRITPPQ